MMMPGREYQAQPSRFGFNGKENDNDVKGFGNQEDYGMRIYDPRIGKFLSEDPLASHYAYYTPYQFAGNKPIWAVDLDGTEEQKTNKGNDGWLPAVVFTVKTKKAKALSYIRLNMPRWDNHYWPKVTPEQFTSQLKDRVKNPSNFSQGDNTNFCWAAAVASYEYQTDPERMAKLMTELYLYGQSQSGDLTLSTAKQIQRTVGSNTFDKNEGLSGQLVDQMLLLTLAHNFKDYVNILNNKYDPGDQNGLWASGTFNKFAAALKAFGHDIYAHGYDVMNVDVTGKNGSVITDEQTLKRDIFLFVNSASFKNPPPEASDPNNFGGPPVGTHFVRIRNFTSVGDNYSFDYLDYGSWKPHVINRHAFERATFGIVTVEKK